MIAENYCLKIRSAVFLLLMLVFQLTSAQNEFITVWKPSNQMTLPVVPLGIHSTTNQIWLPVQGTDYTIYWEEIGYPAHSSTLQNVSSVHNILIDFGSPQNPVPQNATYRIKISDGNGDFTGIRFCNPAVFSNLNVPTGDFTKLIVVEQWGNNVWQTMQNAFTTCSAMNVTATDIPNLSSVTDMTSMFEGCGNLTGNATINNWNISNVTSLVSTFSTCLIFNQPLNNWNTSNVTLMGRTFNMAQSFNQPLSNWNTANVIEMNAMFNNARTFNQPIGNWNTSSLQDCEFMFSNAWTFNQPLNSWDVSDVTDFHNMFNRATVFNSDISGWNTSSAVNMNMMFSFATSFNQNISNWNTSNVTSFNGMFQNAVSFNQNISNWNTAQAVSMNNMFTNATAFNRNLGSWNLSSLLYASSILNNSGLNCQNYDGTLYGWSQNPSTPNNISISSVAPMVYTNSSAVTARNYLINTKGWTIVGDSYDDKCPYTLSTEETALENTISIYPNPASDFIYIKNLKDVVSYKIFDNSGRMISQGKFNEDRIDVRDLTEGNYMIQVVTKNTVKSFKIIKD